VALIADVADVADVAADDSALALERASVLDSLDAPDVFGASDVLDADVVLAALIRTVLIIVSKFFPNCRQRFFSDAIIFCVFLFAKLRKNCKRA
jgi:hypothetical protein